MDINTYKMVQLLIVLSYEVKICRSLLAHMIEKMNVDIDIDQLSKNTEKEIDDMLNQISKQRKKNDE